MSESRTGWRGGDYVLSGVVMGLMGAFYWAIRGTGGFGGSDGGTFAGFGWALLWYAFSVYAGPDGARRPYGTPWMLWAITLGIAFGGMTGYGVYISWLNGRFHLDYPDLVRDVPAWTGYAMLFVCGFHWGGNAGCFMAWCAPTRRVTGRDWAIRISCGIAGAVAAAVFVRVFPQLFLPYYAEGLYDVDEYKTCQRALGSIRNIAPHVGLVLGFLAYELARGDRRAVGMILTMALGFAIPFTVGRLLADHARVRFENKLVEELGDDHRSGRRNRFRPRLLPVQPSRRYRARAAGAQIAVVLPIGPAPLVALGAHPGFGIRRLVQTPRCGAFRLDPLRPFSPLAYSHSPSRRGARIGPVTGAFRWPPFWHCRPSWLPRAMP